MLWFDGDLWLEPSALLIGLVFVAGVVVIGAYTWWESRCRDWLPEEEQDDRFAP